MQPDLTSKQKRLLQYLQQEISRRGSPPSLRQAASDLGVSHAAVGQMLRALEEKGCLKRDGRYSRNIYLLNRSREAAALHRWREVPVIGRITAGLPMYAQQEWGGSVVVDGDIFRGTNLFALRVRGDSMKNAGILDGDLAICKPRQYVRDGEIVVALIDGEEATVKRFFLYKDHIQLRPENPAFQMVRYGFGEIMIQGRVIGIHRGPDVMEGV